MGFVNIFALSLPSQLRVFVRFENSSLPRIWKVPNLVFIFNILFGFMLYKMMATGVKRSRNWHVAIIICDSYRLRTNNSNNYSYNLHLANFLLWPLCCNFCRINKQGTICEINRFVAIPLSIAYSKENSGSYWASTTVLKFKHKEHFFIFLFW